MNNQTHIFCWVGHERAVRDRICPMLGINPRTVRLINDNHGMRGMHIYDPLFITISGYDRPTPPDIWHMVVEYGWCVLHFDDSYNRQRYCEEQQKAQRK